MDRVLRLWSAVSWWLVPLGIIALGAVGIAQNDSLFSEGTNTTFSGPAAVHAGFLLLVTVPLCWRFRAPVTVVIVVTASTGTWVLAMFPAHEQPPFEPVLAIYVALFALASRTDGRPLWTDAAVSAGIFATGGIRTLVGIHPEDSLDPVMPKQRDQGGHPSDRAEDGF
jgi:hypothetical protein